MKNLFKKAHKMTRKIKSKHPEVNYKFQFSLCLSFLYKNKEEEPMSEARKKVLEAIGNLENQIKEVEEKIATLPELTGSEKQIKWAISLRNDSIENNMRKIDKSMNRIGEILRNIDPDTGNQLIAIQYKTAFSAMKNLENASTETSAKWWIDNR